jgi:hypothetical protein
VPIRRLSKRSQPWECHYLADMRVDRMMFTVSTLVETLGGIANTRNRTWSHQCSRHKLLFLVARVPPTVNLTYT